MEQRRDDTEWERWPPPAHPAVGGGGAISPGWGTVIWRGLAGRCPACGKTPIFAGYLKVREICATCGAPLGQMPADDAPPYVAMIAVLHLVALFTIFAIHGNFIPGPPLAILLLAVLAGICMVALRLAKGAVIGILLKLGLKREPLRG